MINLRQLLKTVIEKGASDLHITSGTPPQLRVDGSLVPLKLDPLNPNETKQICYSILTDSQKQRFEEENELDLAVGVKGLGRFRGNVFVQRGAVAAVFRHIPYRIQSIEELGLPPILGSLVMKTQGLILVTGPTGMGKTTTLAAMIDKINSDQRKHIVTIEDPIEYLHPHKKCIVNQREVASDTESFAKALKYILRQDPDVVFIGEMRDLETIEAALKIAETGHLALATLHTNSAVQTINRVIDVFPPHHQQQVRTQLSFVLEAVISQSLLPRSSNQGRIMAVELMLINSAIRNLMRENKIHQIYGQMQMGQATFGMQTMNQALFSLYQRRMITQEVAISRSYEPIELQQMLDEAEKGSEKPRSAAM